MLKMRMKRLVATALLAGLAACGSGTVDGEGFVTVQGLAPGQQILCSPQGTGGGGTILIEGSGFLSEHGVNLIVRFDAVDGTPLQGGTSDTETVTAEVLSDTLIEAGAPDMVGDAVVTITVILPGGNSGTSPESEITIGGTLVGPFAIPDLYNAIGNVPLTVAAGDGVTVNDIPRQCGLIPQKPVAGDPSRAMTGTVVGFDAVSGNGGTVAVNADGSFTYSPPTGFNGLDTFGYTMEDDGVQSSATVTISVTDMVWFIDDLAAPGGDGHFERPLDSLLAFQAIQGGGAGLPAPGHWIYVYRGSGMTYDGGIQLLDQQHLIGQGVVLEVQGVTIVPAGLRPTLTNSGIVVGETFGDTVVELASGNEVRGLDIEGPADFGIRGIFVSGPCLIDQVSIDGMGADGINLDLVDGDFQVGDPAGSGQSRVVITNVGGTGIFLGGISPVAMTITALTGTSAAATLNVVGATIESTVEGNGIDAINANLDVSDSRIDDTFYGIHHGNYLGGVLCTSSIDGVNIGMLTPSFNRGIFIEPWVGNIQASVSNCSVVSGTQALFAGSGNAGGGIVALSLADNVFEQVAGPTVSNTVEVFSPGGSGRAYVTNMSGTNVVHGNNIASGVDFIATIFDADPDTAGIQPVSGGDWQIGTSTTERIVGTALECTSCEGDLTIGTFTVFQQGGAATGVTNVGGSLILTITTSNVDQVP